MHEIAFHYSMRCLYIQWKADAFCASGRFFLLSLNGSLLCGKMKHIRMPWELERLKLLFVCSTELQLFNALNLKLHVFPNDSADIVIQFLKKDTVDFYNRVRESGLFENVCYRLPDVFGLHEFARCVRNGDYSHSLVTAAKNSGKDCWTHLSSRSSHDFIDNIRERVYNVDSLDFSAYQEVFAGG